MLYIDDFIILGNKLYYDHALDKWTLILLFIFAWSLLF